MPSISNEVFGAMASGQSVSIYTLSNATMSVKVLTRGCTLYEVNVPDKNGTKTNVISNLPTVADYEKRRTFFGSCIGRYGNRIADGRFTLDGKEYTLAKNNNGKHALHGGALGYDTVLFTPELATANDQEATLVLGYLSPDGEEGYPGNLKVQITYSLTADNRFRMCYTATTDKRTVVNLTNHSFWNLAGKPSASVLDHRLLLGADRYLPASNGLIPTGEVISVKGTPYDFCTEKTVGRDIAKIDDPQFAGGYDHCLVLADKPAGALSFAARLTDPASGRTMTIETTEPAIQLYTGNFLDGTLSSNEGWNFPKQSMLCLETQHYPDSPNQPAFPSTVLEPGATYSSVTVHLFGVET